MSEGITYDDIVRAYQQVENAPPPLTEIKLTRLQKERLLAHPSVQRIEDTFGLQAAGDALCGGMGLEMSNDLVERLLAVIGETERIAKDAAGVPWVDDVPGMVQVDSTVIRDNKIAYGHLGYVAGTDPTPLGDAYRKHIVRQDPDSVLRRCVADRRIVELHAGDHECREMHTGVYPPDWPATAAYGKPGETWRHACTECFEGKPCDTLKALAEGYGVSVEEP